MGLFTRQNHSLSLALSPQHSVRILYALFKRSSSFSTWADYTAMGVQHELFALAQWLGIIKKVTK